MDRFGQRTRQFQGLLQGLTASPRLLVTGLAIAVITVSVWSILDRDSADSWISLEVSLSGPRDPGAEQGESNPKPLGAKERQRVTAALETAGIRRYRFENEVLQVPTGQVDQANEVLRRLTAGDDRWTTDWEKQVGQLGPFPTAAQYDQAREIALRKEIRRLLLAVPEIAEVQVLLARSRSPRSFPSRRRRVTATIGIRPATGVQLIDTQLETLRQVVAGGVPDLVAEDVVIFNQSALTEVDSRAGPVPVVRGQQPEAVVPPSASSEASGISWGFPLAIIAAVIVLILVGGLLAQWTRPSRVEVPVPENGRWAGTGPPVTDEETVDEPGESTAAVVDEAEETVTVGSEAGPDDRGSESPLAFLVDVDPGLLAGWLQDDHPQAAAIVLAELPTSFQEEVLDNLVSELREDLEDRLNSVGTPHADVLDDLAETLKDRWWNAESNVTGTTVSSPGERVEPSTGGWSGSDVALLQAVEGVLSEFADMGNLEASVVRGVFDRLGPRSFCLALAGAALEVRERILDCLPRVASLELKRDIDRQGPVRLSDIERSQREILKQARRHLAANQVSAPGEGV
ncbi:MAG: hypothetical protein CMJ65_12530 [Planctomycetaceae bacterium]|jgi:hypothetical protein|nr:hypothetical protein [Planctomycetaceae bacterium]MDP7274300.1 FliG C-terminal domain-containing protein [Planctomycetaceae bacterium]